MTRSVSLLLVLKLSHSIPMSNIITNSFDTNYLTEYSWKITKRYCIMKKLLWMIKFLSTVRKWYKMACIENPTPIWFYGRSPKVFELCDCMILYIRKMFGQHPNENAWTYMFKRAFRHVECGIGNSCRVYLFLGERILPTKCVIPLKGKLNGYRCLGTKYLSYL